MADEKNDDVTRAPGAVVIGGGLAGLMATLKLVEAGVNVDLFSVVPAKRSHSVCAQGGINAVMDTKGEGDSIWEHIDDTIYGGDFLADQGMVRKMCEQAPAIIELFDRMGVMFNRTPEGLLDLRRFGGTKKRRTVFAGATTGQQLLYALDEQVRAHETTGKVRRHEGWTFVSAVIDEGECKGIIAQNLDTMELAAFPAKATIAASGGCGAVFGRSTNSTISTGYVAAKLYRQGAWYANGEFIQIHPTAIPGLDKNRLMSESARGEGGRIWTWKDGKPWYFLEEKYPAYGNLVPRDIATREIFDVIFNQGLGVDGKNVVYLDVTHIDPHVLDNKLGGIMDIYEKFVGQDPRAIPMQIAPSVHYSMGGLWVDDQQRTNIAGLFAAGECDFSQHGANRLGANSLLSAVYGGMAAGPAAARWIAEQSAARAGEQEAAPTNALDDAGPDVFERALQQEREAFDRLLALDGPQNPYTLHAQLGELMTKNVTVVRDNAALEQTLVELNRIKEQWRQIGLDDHGRRANASVVFVRELGSMIDLAKIITAGALARDESRGSHYKPAFPERDDKNWLKTTIASYDSATDGPVLSYRPVDVSLIEPRKRDYSTTHGTAAPPAKTANPKGDAHA